MSVVSICSPCSQFPNGSCESEDEDSEPVWLLFSAPFFVSEGPIDALEAGSCIEAWREDFGRCKLAHNDNGMEHEVREAHPTLAAEGTGVIHLPALQQLAREGISVAPPAILERDVGWVASCFLLRHVI
jgi:hypothetical protein